MCSEQCAVCTSHLDRYILMMVRANVWWYLANMKSYPLTDPFHPSCTSHLDRYIRMMVTEVNVWWYLDNMEP